MIDKVIELLEKYINENEAKQEQLSTISLKLSLYDELLPLLNDKAALDENKLFINILLSNIYYNETYNSVFYKAFYALKQNDTKEYKSFVAQIRFDYKELVRKENVLKNQILNASHLVKTARKAIFYLSRRSPLFSRYYTFQNIREIIAYYNTMGEINDREKILLLNELDFYNRNIIPGESKEKEYTNKAFNEVPNILSGGFEMYDEIEIAASRKETILGFVNELKGYVEQLSKEEIIPSIENYKKYNLDDNEYNFIVNEILKFYIFKALEYYDILLDSCIYTDRVSREEAITTYYQMLERYLLIRKYYQNITDIKVDEEAIEEQTSLDEGDKNPIRIVFSHPTNDPTKAKFLNDLKDIPEENYQGIWDLLNDFIEKRKDYKSLTNNGNIKNFAELKEGQIRIIIKHIRNNIHCVVGVFTKKANNDVKTYRNMCNRVVTDVSTIEKENQEIELGIITLDLIKDYINEKARKGSR